MGGQLIQAILDNLYKLWPYRIVDIDERGVRFTFGQPKALTPGGHWFVPGFQTIERYHIAYQEIDCALQSMETKDGIGITVSANVGYVIVDVVKYRTAVYNTDATLERAMRGTLGEIIETSTFEQLRGGRKRLSISLKKELTKQGEEWGVEIRNARLTDFTRTRAYRVFGGLV
jgi:regulator of protease activity HflC (stomatin/prohibitin superfamily)